MAIKIVLPFTAIHRLQCRRRKASADERNKTGHSSAGDCANCCHSPRRIEQLENCPVRGYIY